MAVSGDRLIALLRSALRETDVIDFQGEDLITVLLLYSDKRIARTVGDRLKTGLTITSGPWKIPAPLESFWGSLFPFSRNRLRNPLSKASQMIEKARDSRETGSDLRIDRD